MSLRTQWPYAANAIIRHEWVVNLLNVWVTFKFAMDQNVKPAHGLWICKVDGVLKAITVSAWQDEWTILLTVPNVLALPGRVTLEYDGPSEDLRITWDKQWEPWGAILSIRVPYLWEDILVVDTVNKRVGIQPGVVAASAFGYALTVVSPDGVDQFGLYHDNTDAWMKWTDGILYFITDEGTDHDTTIRIRGKGTGRGIFQVYNKADTGFIGFYPFTSAGLIFVGGTCTRMEIQPAADANVTIFRSATEGETETLELSGWKAGDAAKRTLLMQISPNANNTALWSNVDHYVFDGVSLKTTGRLVSGTLTHALVGPTDNLDVTGVNTVFIDCSGGNVVIGGFTGGVNGQHLNLVRLCAAANDATLEHNEAHAFQKIFLHRGLDETLTGEYGGWTLVCNGTSWFDASHAKHV